MVPSYLIALLVVASLLLLSGFSYYFMVHQKKTAVGGSVGGGSVGGGGSATVDPTCNIQPTYTNGRVRCPPGFTTNYNASVSMAAACFASGIPCNRCIGTSYPQTWLEEDPNLKWELQTILPPNLAFAGVPVATGNKVMKYADSGLYVIESKPLATMSGQKCFGSV